MSTYVDTVTLTVMTCNADGCGISFAVPDSWREARRADHATFYCPNGHTRWFPTGTSDLEKERKARQQAEQRATWANSRADRIQQEREAAERSAAAYKGHVTRLRNRIADGVCPVQTCRRNFANVKAHIETQHPDWAHDHPEALS